MSITATEITEAVDSSFNTNMVTTKKNQQGALYRLIYYSKSALRISGDVFAHHQEHLAVFTASSSVHRSCCQQQLG